MLFFFSRFIYDFDNWNHFGNFISYWIRNIINTFFVQYPTNETETENENNVEQFQPIDILDTIDVEDEDINDRDDNVIDSPYKLGEKVYLRGDTKPDRIWTIKNIGNKFITIETDDVEDLMASDTIRVVSNLDIYPIGNGVFLPFSQEPHVEGTQPSVVNPYPSFSQPPAINIKFVNGSDNSTTGSPIPVSEIPAIDLSNYNPTPIEEPPLDSGEIDFSKNLIIKKI